MVSWLEVGLIFLAGVWAGTINTIVGSGTLVTFPVLVAFGLPARVATMSNAIGQVAGGISGTWGYRQELVGQGPNLRRQMPASVVGALTGAYLLLHLPAATFEMVVPALLVIAIVLVIGQPFLQRAVHGGVSVSVLRAGDMSRSRVFIVVAATYLIGVYGGYFAAAQGVMLVAVMGVLLPEKLQRVNALKNLLSLVTNMVAASSYALAAFNEISWAASGLIAGGTLIGGFIGARIGKRLPPIALRAAIVVLALVAIWKIAI